MSSSKVLLVAKSLAQDNEWPRVLEKPRVLNGRSNLWHGMAWHTAFGQEKEFGDRRAKDSLAWVRICGCVLTSVEDFILYRRLLLSALSKGQAPRFLLSVDDLSCAPWSHAPRLLSADDYRAPRSLSTEDLPCRPQSFMPRIAAKDLALCRSRVSHAIDF